MNLYILAMLIPGVAVAVRRLHDTDHSGWWLLIAPVPLLGNIVLLVFLTRDSSAAPNAWGPSPRRLVAAVPPQAAVA